MLVKVAPSISTKPMKVRRLGATLRASRREALKPHDVAENQNASVVRQKNGLSIIVVKIFISNCLGHRP